MTENDTMSQDSPPTGAGESAAPPDTETAQPSDATPEHLGLSLPDDPHEATTVVLRELVESRQETGELLENLQRLAAEFDNYRKRTERDQIENVLRASQRVIESLLPTLDSLDAALAIEPTSETEQRMIDGMRGTEALLLDALRAEGCERIDALGAAFDPALHEAVQVVPGEGDQVVQQELRKGYTMRGRVIRPSLVVVGHA
jgi:molecular chaperone GrpE